MKFKINESVKKIGDSKNISATYSVFDLKNILLNSTTPQRIAYCPDQELWLVGASNETYHSHMVEDAKYEGLTDIDPFGKFGRFYYIPIPFKDYSRLSYILNHDYTEIIHVKVFKDFFLGCDKNNDPELGAEIFFNLFDNAISEESVEEVDELAIKELM